MGQDTTRRADPARPKGSSYALLLSVRGGPVTVPLPNRGSMVIGRADDAHVVVDDDSLSRHHARVHGGTPPHLEDLGSTNGTRVMGKPLKRGELAPLAVGCIVELGSVAALVQVGGHDVEASAMRGPAPRNAESSPIVRDPVMKKYYALIELFAASALPVLILGETGVGKDVYAAAVHARSPRATRAFVRLNCAALPESILESELFGYEKGAFTGAVQSKPGLLETADGGSVFLDEVGDMALATQAKLLRVLENGEVTRLGSVRTKRIDVRMISATNHDLEARVRAGSFRRDLFFRLNGVVVHLPPLRQRPDDILALAEHYTARAPRPPGRDAIELTREAKDQLLAYGWPGNIRELKNTLERAVLFCDGRKVDACDLTFGLGSEGLGASPSACARSMRAEVKDLERERILAALGACDGNQTEAAKRLGMSRRTLVNRLDEFGLARPRKRRAAEDEEP